MRIEYNEPKTVCVVGLGYVGLPLAEAFAKHLNVIGFDIDAEKIGYLNKNLFRKKLYQKMLTLLFRKKLYQKH